ncbi:hypothetical protein C2S53_000972 [Perilla frutescens var. hirtella]|uniref:Uncharacterized protein n=1 Tax=Perilla frutescens var. hirtella TaxID=608512 RepID=A0AAD4P4A4_PERFH|nr:hypothetical protein C2S53_000972 [Perilla frutescens var. hirtella]
MRRSSKSSETMLRFILKKFPAVAGDLEQKRDRQETQDNEGSSEPSTMATQNQTHQSPSTPIEQNPVPSIEHDLGKRKQVCEYSVNVQDEIRCAYLKVGPYQPKLEVYPGTQFGNRNRSFQKK